MVSVFDTSLALGLVEGDGDGCVGGVADFVDVDEDFLGRQPQSMGGGFDDARVGLVGYEQIHVVNLEVRGFEGL